MSWTETANNRRATGWTVAASAALTAVNVSALMVALQYVLDRHDETGIATAVFDGYFLFVVIVGVVNGLGLACFGATRHVGVGVVLGTVFAASCLSVAFFVLAAGSGSIS
jgi:hypothetical protein